jgi:hypothetical protein
MMKHASRVGVLMLTIALAGSGRADAGGLWDWLEELNGPGPSTGRSLPFMVSFLCRPFADGEITQSTSKSKNAVRKVLKIPDQVQQGKVNTCLYFDSHAFHAEQDVHYHDVDSRLWEFGVTTKLHPTVEIGGGLGRFSFSSHEDATGRDLNGQRFAVTFPRIAFKPLLAIPGAPKSQALGLVQLYFKYTIIVGTLEDEDFANFRNIDFIRKNQRVESVGLTLDLTAAANLVANWIK